jgi:filamentous hemagglutinin family protein
MTRDTRRSSKRNSPQSPLILKPVALAVALCAGAGAALANPTGPTVVNGQVSFNPAGNLLSITNSPNSIIHWQSFSIGANEITRFLQQSAASAVLNRVTGAGGPIDPSVILGALQSNGRVFLINPAGVLFGAGAQIDVAGLIASSLNLSNQDFLAGRLRFTEAAGAGAIVNQGAINAASGGQVYLVGPSVTNSGIITTPQGEVVLAAGNSVELVNPGTPNLRVEVSAPENEARNLGRIVADAGRVGIYAGLIDHSGTIRADSAVATADGRIVLKATKSATLEAGSVTTANGPSGGSVTVQSGDTTLVSGAIEATGSAGIGGTVRVLGNLVGLTGNATIDASGETGGGTVLVGGDYRGGNPEVQNAFRTYFGQNATVKADAIGSGDGGKVIVWSDDATRAYGTISARGGSQSGDGGFVEVSGRNWLDFQAKVDTGAANGRTGTLLLDPADVEIGTCGGSFSGGLFSGGSGTSQLSWSGIDANLDSSNVIITTDGSGGPLGGTITVVNSSPSLTMFGNSLSLVAHNNVILNGTTITGDGDVNLYAGWNGADPFNPAVTAGTGDISLNFGEVLTSGNVTFVAGRNIGLISGSAEAGFGGSPVGAHSVTFTAGGGISLTDSDGSSLVRATGGPGGDATVTFNAGSSGITISSSSVLANGGNSGAGPGGSATVILSAPGPVSLSNSEVVANGGNGTNANGGNATVFIESGSDIAMDNSFVGAIGGSAGGASGAGGSGLVQLVADGNINVTNSFFGLLADGRQGPSAGGSGTTTLSAGGSVNIQNSFLGAEGSMGAPATVTVAANGSVTVGSNSVFLADQLCCSSGSDGTAAQINLFGNSVTVDGFSGVWAYGGQGSTNGGAASVNMTAAGASSLHIDGAEGIGAFGGFGPTKGGDAATTLSSVGPITINNSFVSAGGGGNTPVTGGNASTFIGSSAGSVLITDSHIEAIGGEGSMAGGSAVTDIGSLAAGVTLQGSGSSLTVQSIGGGTIGLGGVAGTGQVNLIAVGPILVTSESVFADGGFASQGKGGDGILAAASGTSFTMMDASVGAYGGFGTQRGGAATLVVSAPIIHIESTGVPATLLSSGGSSDALTGILGAATATLIPITVDGRIDIINERVEVSGGQVGSAPGPVSFGAGTINITFPDRFEGTGYSLNGVEGAITAPAPATTSTLSSIEAVALVAPPPPLPFGFLVNGQPAIPGVNFFVTYASPPPPPVVPPEAPPPPVDALQRAQGQFISSINSVVDSLTSGEGPESGAEGATGGTGEPGGDKDKKKKATVCN